MTETYRIRAEREGKFWLLRVPELDVVTQVRRLTDAEEMVRDLIAVWLEVDPGSFGIELDVSLPDDLACRRERAMRLRAQAEELRSESAEELRAVAQGARAAGLTVRELAIALGVSHQRAQQILSEAPARRTA
ncbi:hypothetical protein [Longispora albida]|uniref:hypothetical protein n=1 Tax=Longispora albida TaxID=203523 RepID=UPI00036B283F|nr:hypothetical protein [Longispora albida]